MQLLSLIKSTMNHIKPKNTLLLVWPLLVGVFFIMMGNGLQGTLLGISANLASFDTQTIGIIMSLYYCGYLVGCYFAPRMIGSVGHIRVFAAMASLASTTILINGYFLNEFVWALMRFISGISFACLFIVAESWLNRIAPNKRRAQIFSAYVFIINFGFFGGQFLLYFGSPANISLFILVSVLISLAMLPITLANKPAPGNEIPEPAPLRKLLKQSPLSFGGVFTSGFCTGSVLGFAPIFLGDGGATKETIANFIAIYILGSALIPLFVGALSDRMDRRKFIVIIAVIACGLSAYITWRSYNLLTIFSLGGVAVCLYSVSIAYMNDKLRSEQIVSAASTLIMANGMGACLGPLLSSILYQNVSMHSFFPMLLGMFILLTLIGIWRMIVGEDIDVEEQSEFVNIPARAAPSILEITAPKKK